MPDSAAVPRALTIAGSDSGGGAGIQADLKTFAALGVYGASAIAAVTAQDTHGVHAALTLPPALVAAQVDAVLGDIGAGAVKTGMLGDAGVVTAVAERLRTHGVTQLVIDPVLVATSGDRLLDDPGLDALRRELLPLALVATPNVREAEALCRRTLRSWDDVRAAAREIVKMGARSVVITGGDANPHTAASAHLRAGSAANGDSGSLDDADGPAARRAATDLYFDGQTFREYTAVRVNTRYTHGTGCTFSAAIAAGLARGMDVQGAISLAKSYVTLALEYAYPVGQGRGPVHHFYRYWQPVGARYIAGASRKAGTVTGGE